MTVEAPDDGKVIEFDAAKAWAKFGEGFAAVVFLVWVAVWRGFALTCAWRWIIVGTFPGIPEISIPAAIGIALLIRYLVPDGPPSGKSFWHKMFDATIAASLMLASAWLLHFFM